MTLLDAVYPLANLVALSQIKKIWWRNYPALVAGLSAEAVFGITVGAVPASWSMIQPLRMFFRLLIVFEIFRFSCVPLHRRERWTFASTCCGASCALAFRVGGDLDALQTFVIARQWFQIVVAIFLVGLVILRRDLIESEEHRAYRIGAAALAVEVAISGSFVRSGIGYALFPFSIATYHAVDVAFRLLASATVVWIGHKMSRSYSSRIENLKGFK